MPINRPRKGSFSKSGVGSQQLNELMLRYAQDNQISNGIMCIIQGADVNYRDGALLTIACYLGRPKLLKAVLAAGPTKGLGTALNIARQANDDRLLVLLNDYMAKNNLQEGDI